jgi:hypothetical protein
MTYLPFWMMQRLRFILDITARSRCIGFWAFFLLHGLVCISTTLGRCCINTSNPCAATIVNKSLLLINLCITMLLGEKRSHYATTPNTREEIDTFVVALKEAIAFFGGLFG